VDGPGHLEFAFRIQPKGLRRKCSVKQPVHLEQSRNTLVIAQNGKLIVMKGLEDFIVVDTEDCLLVYPKKDEQEIKELKQRLGKTGLESYL
jgi:mannose-1-phosphate guanylyltransferase